MRNKILSFLCCFVFVLPAYAIEASIESEENPDVYSLEYAKNSPIHNIPLQNASLRIQLFTNGNPKGFLDIETDDKQSFNLESDEVFEVVSIKGEEKYNARCSGYATIQNKTIAITCNKRNR